MNYQETIEYLFNSTPVFEKVGASAYKEGLFNTEELDRHFGHPHRKFKTIHVAGTNGKGSCSHTLAAILQSAGYKVGLYTSPHLVDFRERIRINGECIDEQYVINFVEQESNFLSLYIPRSLNSQRLLPSNISPKRRWTLLLLRSVWEADSIVQTLSRHCSLLSLT